MGTEHPELEDRELARDVADVERITRTVGRIALAAGLASPAWLVLLLVFPAMGLGVGLSLLFSSLLAGALTFVLWRWVLRGTVPAPRLTPAVRRTMLLCAVLIVLYVVVVVRAGG